MAREPNRSPAGVKGRNQKCVRYDNKRGDNFKVYATFGSVNSITMKFFQCFIKCYECLARGNRESDGLKKFPALHSVMKNFLPLISLPADFEVRPKADKISALAKLASNQAKEAAGMYQRNQASVPLDGGCGSGHQLENPEGRPPTFPVEQPIGMPFSQLDLRSNYIQLPDGTWAKGGGYVENSLESVPRLTGRERANEGDVYPPVYNGDDDIVQQQSMKWAMEGDDNQTHYPDDVQVDASNATYHRSACLRVDLRSYLSGSDLEELRVQQFHGTRAKKNSMLPSPLGNQLEGFGGESVGASNPSQFGEHEKLPSYIQQIPDEFDAEQGDDIQTNHLDDMQVEEISAADPASAGRQVDARVSVSGNTPEEIPVLPHGTWAEVDKRSGVGRDAIYSHSRIVCMEGGNTEPLSDILEGVPRDTGRNRADMDFYEWLPFPDRTPEEWLAFEQEHCVEKYMPDPNQLFAHQVKPPNPEGGVNEGIYSIDTFPA